MNGVDPSLDPLVEQSAQISSMILALAKTALQVYNNQCVSGLFGFSVCGDRRGDCQTRCLLFFIPFSFFRLPFFLGESFWVKQAAKWPPIRLQCLPDGNAYPWKKKLASFVYNWWWFYWLKHASFYLWYCHSALCLL